MMKGSITHSEPNGNTHIRNYFKQLQLRFRVGLVLAFIIPLLAQSVYFHFQLQFTLKDTGKLNLAAIAESQRNTVDLFLQERLVNILSLFYSKECSLSPTRQRMEAMLQNLRQVSDVFIDVGFLTDQGVQIGYAGPYPYLQDQDYSSQKWFVDLVERERSHYISDIYMGYRKKLHFTIAVKQIIDGRAYILRSTLDPDKFYLFLRTIHHGKGVESFIINSSGQYQVVDPSKGLFLTACGFVPPKTSVSGAREIERNGDAVLIAYAWLSETKWALIVSEPLSLAYAQLYRARRIMLTSASLFLLMVVAAIWFATRTLIVKAQENAEQREALHLQLLHASKLASLGELSAGVAHEINNPLAIIMASTGVVKDMLNPEFKLDSSPPKILKELYTIDSAVFRARGITQQLLDYGRKNSPQKIASDINHIMDEVLGGVKEREFAIKGVGVVRDYASDLPRIMVDPDQIKQVFVNLVNNAGDATPDLGKITISTKLDSDNARITIIDTGEGMDSETVKKIFDPFFTTKEIGKGTGLGLSVSLGIVESMGGTIEVQSIPGQGSAFTVVLPIASEKEQK